MLALAPPDLSGANARVDARPSMKDEALPHCGSDGERRGRAADAAAGPVLARPNFFRTCLPPRDVVDRATERLNPPRFRAICTVAYRSPPAQDCLTSRRSLVRAQYRPLVKSRPFAGLSWRLSWLEVILGWVNLSCVDQSVDHADWLCLPTRRPRGRRRRDRRLTATSCRCRRSEPQSRPRCLRSRGGHRTRAAPACG